MRRRKMMTAVNNRQLKTLLNFFFFAPILFLLLNSGFAQQSDTAIDKKRLRKYTTTFAAGYGLSIIGMHYLWYKDSENQSFQFFNDNAEWKQVDKLGHFYTAFHLSATSASLLKDCDVENRKAEWIGAATGFLILLPVEIFDGFSKDYGTSAGDLVANAGGGLFFLGQQALWNEVRLHPKVSFHYTAYPSLRPSLLGDNSLKEIFKDYNGQTYWISGDVDTFIKFPKWLNIAFGYGAHNMIFARDHQNLAAGYSPYRQYYIGLDFDLSSIRTRSKILKTLIAISRAVKFPAPTIEFSRNKAHFHILYF
jgi:hypothetical protein